MSHAEGQPIEQQWRHFFFGDTNNDISYVSNAGSFFIFTLKGGNMEPKVKEENLISF